MGWGVCTVERSSRAVDHYVTMQMGITMAPEVADRVLLGEVLASKRPAHAVGRRCGLLVTVCKHEIPMGCENESGCPCGVSVGGVFHFT